MNWIGFRAWRQGALLLLACTLLACPKSAADDAIRIGVDATLRDLGVAEVLVTAFETEAKARASVTYASTEELERLARAGECDYALLASDPPKDALEREGIAIRSAVWAHEELVLIGPFQDQLGRYKDDSGSDLVRNIARSNYRFLLARPGSAERVVLEALFRKSGDVGMPGSFFRTDLEGKALVLRALETQSMALVKRSSLLMAIVDGQIPHRIYREGDAALVLRLWLLEVHPARTKRARQPAFFDLAMGEKGRAILAAFGRDRFGYAAYGVGEPEEGQGAKVPGLEKELEEKAPPAN